MRTEQEKLHFLKRDLILAPAMGQDAVTGYILVEKFLEPKFGTVKESHAWCQWICSSTDGFRDGKRKKMPSGWNRIAMHLGPSQTPRL